MIGTTISHYRIVEELGKGGMGIVYRAVDVKLDRPVAIKLLAAHMLASESDRKRFFREARAAAALNHPNIATVYEIDETEDGRPFIAMEIVEGQTLEDLVGGSPLPLDRVVSIGIQIAEALQAAHEKQIVHRDIKSANIMVTRDGRAKVLDFGLAKTIASTKLTQMDSTVGTIAYMSPEQARGEEVGPRTDLWSLGIVLYEMISGTPPFPGDYPQAVVYNILNGEAQPLTTVRTGVPMELEQLVAKCLRKDVALRYQSASGVIADLKSATLSESKFSHHRDELVEKRGRRDSGARVRRLAAITVPIITVALLAVYLLGRGSSMVTPSAQDGPPMVAVLPFSSSSLGGESEFLADGIHDDLLTQLSKLQSIRVISRTSVLEYRNTTKNVREIGAELGAKAILEGGVQSAGDRIRINAQLIDAATDAHLWAETFDRELSTANIFDIQSEIARAIANALNATLTAQDATQMALIPTQDMAAYRAYHEAMAIRAGGDSHTPEYREALERATALDSTYTRAEAEYIGTLSYANLGTKYPDMLLRAEEGLRRLGRIAPQSADHFIAQGYYTYYVLRDYDRAHELVDEAVKMTPSDANLLELRSYIERRQGDFSAMVETLRLAAEVDPREGRWPSLLVSTLVLSHRYKDARIVLDSTTLEQFTLDFYRAILPLQDDGDFEDYLGRMRTVFQKWDDEDPRMQWFARVANRDFSGAEAVLHAAGGNRTSANVQSMEILTAWLMRRDDVLATLVTEARKQLGADRDVNNNFQAARSWQFLGLVEAVAGNRQEAVQFVRRYHREVSADWAERTAGRHDSCRILGVAGAVDEAVECLRTGLTEPSYVLPFLEPVLPFYDSIRTEPAFVDLLGQIEAGDYDDASKKGAN